MKEEVSQHLESCDAMDLLRQFVTERDEITREWERCVRKADAANLIRDDWEYLFWKSHEDLMARQIECHDELMTVAVPAALRQLQIEQERQVECAYRNLARLRW